MKTIVMINNIDMIDKLMDKVDGFLFGIKDFSVNFPIYIDIDELKIISKRLKDKNKKLFISLNKNMHNNDLIKLKELLKEINNIDIDGILYYDVCLVNLKCEGHVKAPLIWHQEHLTTNYATCNFWFEQGVNGAFLSSEITLDEIKEIRNNTDMELFVQIFGYIPMFTSKRKLVNNYLDTFNLTSDDNMHLIKKEGNSYPIIDDHTKTEVYSANILNGISEKEIMNDIDYVVFNTFNINDDEVCKIIDLYNNLNNDNIDETNEQINLLFPNNDKGFFYKETIFKVKKNDK